MKGIDDYLAPDPRELIQDTMSKQVEFKGFALTYESDLGFANLKVMASVQEDDILVVRDNDRHSFEDIVLWVCRSNLSSSRI